MKKYLAHISLSLVAFATGAQNTWTMEECMAYAAEHSPAVEQARWDLATSETNRSEALAQFFPSVSAQIGTQLNWGRNIDPETNTYNNVTTFNNGYGIYASLTLFDGGETFNRYRQARAEVKRSRSAMEIRRDDRAISAMAAYADAVYYKGAIDIAADKLQQSKATLELTRLQEELGTKGYPEVAQAEASVADDEYNLVRQKNLYTQAMIKLRSDMNLPYDEPLELDTAIFHKPVTSTVSENAESVYSLALVTNPSALESKMNVESMRYGYLRAKALLYPTISVSAGISTSYYRTITGGFESPGFGEQFRNNRGEYVSATISIPLFSNLGRLSSVKRARHELAKAESEREERLRKLHDDIAAAITDRDGYAMEILSLESKVKADAMAYNLNSRKYEEGLLTLIDRQLSANTYFNSRLSLLQKRMLYILKIKLVEYYKGDPTWMSK